MRLSSAPPLRSFHLNVSHVSPFFTNSFANLIPGYRARMFVCVGTCFSIGINLEVFTSLSEELGALQFVYFKPLNEHSVNSQQYFL